VLTNTIKEAIQASPSDPKVYVLNAEAELRQFPPTYLAVCELDPLRDDGLILKDALETAGYVRLPKQDSHVKVSSIDTYYSQGSGRATVLQGTTACILGIWMSCSEWRFRRRYHCWD
jgi:acetyl esterase/lipase